MNLIFLNKVLYLYAVLNNTFSLQNPEQYIFCSWLFYQEFEFEDRSRYAGRRYPNRDARMADAYNRAQPKKITVLKNGEPTIHHVVLINRRTAQQFEQILSDISGMFSIAVRKLYTVEGRKVGMNFFCN